ncbi:hypothetical protein CXB51_016590 [Gossypium anomalum]|uniref:DUF4283 domain-containing protein n=1 Tax=Gossypium anomalum TaxID=47600 RepID=A0A8J5Z051_9ROSI|nr:hypothetical protein CXB51_016590 [Gossypium anomalum]
MDCTNTLALKPISFRDAVINTNPTNNSLESIGRRTRIFSYGKESMSKMVVVKLLCGKSAIMLSNKVCALWKPSMRFQIMDIENDYYLAKFESVHDYKKVLADGPWVIYGHYLTVQPWSNFFQLYSHFPIELL